MQPQLKLLRKTNMATGKIKVNFKMPTPSAADRMYAKHQAIRKAAGLPDVDNNPDRPDAGKYISGQSKPVKRVTPIATPKLREAKDSQEKVTESADDDPKADQMTTDDAKFPKKSRKAQIVKSAAKKLPPEDQFQAKPVLDSQVAQQTNK